jgi:hypothetical protein
MTCFNLHYATTGFSSDFCLVCTPQGVLGPSSPFASASRFSVFNLKKGVNSDYLS